jgi:hypothetical protein
MAHKDLVDLTEEEQGYLLDVIHKGKTVVRVNWRVRKLRYRSSRQVKGMVLPRQ